MTYQLVHRHCLNDCPQFWLWEIMAVGIEPTILGYEPTTYQLVHHHYLNHTSYSPLSGEIMTVGVEPTILGR